MSDEAPPDVPLRIGLIVDIRRRAAEEVSHDDGERRALRVAAIDMLRVLGAIQVSGRIDGYGTFYAQDVASAAKTVAAPPHNGTSQDLFTVAWKMRLDKKEERELRKTFERERSWLMHRQKLADELVARKRALDKKLDLLKEVQEEISAHHELSTQQQYGLSDAEINGLSSQLEMLHAMIDRQVKIVDDAQAELDKFEASR